VHFLSQFWSNQFAHSQRQTALKRLLGYTPKNRVLYEKAFTHRSVNVKNDKGVAINFERLEFLGDSVIGTIVANFLFKSLEEDNEGELTRMKSKIVSREKLNAIGKDLNLLEHLICTGNKNNFKDDIHGNLLEALIGAVFIDKGYEKCKKVVFKIILDPYISLDDVRKEIISYKGAMIEWGQKEKHKIEFITTKENSRDDTINYQCHLHLNDSLLIKVREVSKKKAEEKAAKRAFKILKIKRDI